MGDALTDIRIDICDDPAMAAIVSAVCVETFTETFGHLYRPEDLNAYLRDKCGPDAFRRVIADEAYRVWLARAQNGEVVGYAVAGVCDLPVEPMPENAGELMRLYVRQRLQGGGLGVKLLETALDWLESAFRHVYLSVYAENHGAQRLYARYGFEKVAEYSYMVGEHADPEFIMLQRR